jgi:hypothetical protein
MATRAVREYPFEPLQHIMNFILLFSLDVHLYTISNRSVLTEFIQPLFEMSKVLHEGLILGLLERCNALLNLKNMSKVVGVTLHFINGLPHFFGSVGINKDVIDLRFHKIQNPRHDLGANGLPLNIFSLFV